MRLYPTEGSIGFGYPLRGDSQPVQAAGGRDTILDTKESLRRHCPVCGCGRYGREMPEAKYV